MSDTMFKKGDMIYRDITSFQSQVLISDEMYERVNTIDLCIKHINRIVLQERFKDDDMTRVLCESMLAFGTISTNLHLLKEEIGFAEWKKSKEE